MRLMTCIGAVVLAFGIAYPGSAEDKTASASDPNRKICKKSETTGTRLGAKRECRSKAEWDEIADVAKEDLRRTIELGAAGNPR